MTPSPRVSSNPTSNVSVRVIARLCYIVAGKSISRRCKLTISVLNCVEPGEYVGEDEIVARIETDKVTVDILSTHAGVIK